MRKNFLFLFLILMLSACGNSGSTSQNTPLNPIEESPVTLQYDRTYIVYPGDKIVKTSKVTQVAITHIDGDTRSTVRLISGNAQLLRAQSSEI